MRGVIDRGTGRDLRALGATGDLAGKTGTTQRYADGWFIVMRPGLVVGSWVGFDDQRVTFRSKRPGAGLARRRCPSWATSFGASRTASRNGRFPGPNDTGDFLSFETDDDSSYYPAEGDLVDPSEVDWIYEEEPFDPQPRAEPAYERPETDRPRLRSDGPPSEQRPRPTPRTAPEEPRPAYEPAPLPKLPAPEPPRSGDE